MNTTIITTATKPLSRGQRRRLNRRKNLQTNQKQVTPNNQQRKAVSNPPQKRVQGQVKNSPQRRNPYLDTLQNPDIAGVKIPDLVAFPTATLQMTYDGFVSVGTAGGDSLCIGLSPIMGDGVSIWPMTFYTGATPGAIGTSAIHSWPSRTAAAGAFSSFRPVSGYVEIEYVGDSQTDGGTLVGALQPRNLPAPTTVSSLMTLPGCRTSPLRAGRMRCHWKPQDNSDFEFHNSAWGPSNYPVAYVAATGLSVTGASAKSVLKYRVVANFEATAAQDTFDLIDQSPSPINLGWLADAMSWGASHFSAVSIMSGASTLLTMGAAAQTIRRDLRGARLREIDF